MGFIASNTLRILTWTSFFSFSVTRISTSRSSLHELRGEMNHLNYNLDDYCLQNLPVPNHNKPDTTFTHQEEKRVLKDVYHSSGGSSWSKSTGWLDDNVPHCSWYGVTCNNETHYVISLDLPNNNLTNRLPSSLWKLRNLIALCAPSNTGISGELRFVISPNMTRLKKLDIAYCSLTGHIPDYISSMTNLVKIRVCCQRGRGLSGHIPHGIGNLTQLQVLSIGENNIDGDIPASIGNLSKLWFLDLETLSGLKGNIELFYNLSAIRYLHLSDCGIHGTLSDDFGTFYPGMRECLLPQNHLHGNIPRSINSMQNLTQIVLSQNQFTGVIPKTIGEIPSLRIIDFSNNNLHGFQNGTTFRGTQIEILILSGNRYFSADFGEFIDTFMPQKQSTVRIINASCCNLTGNIPAKLWALHNLMSIDIQNNKISGKFPSVDFDTIFLMNIDFSNNLLSGSIPPSFSTLHVLQNLDVSGNLAMASPLGDKRELQNFLEADLSVFVKKNALDKFSCPYFRFIFNNGLVILDPSYYAYSFCVCDSGYYGYAAKCQKCMTGSQCKDTGVTYPSVMTVDRGYWPSPSPGNATHLVPCNPVSDQNTACNPNGSCQCNLEVRNGTYHTRCRQPLCQPGSYKRYCSKCRYEYYRSGNVCLKCPHYSINISVFITILAVSLVILWWAFVYVRKKIRKLAFIVAVGQVIVLATLWCFDLIPGWLFEVNLLILMFYVAGSGTDTRGLLKISIFYIQIVDAMISGYNSWPPVILQAHHYISSIINFHLPGMACQFPSLFTPVGKLVGVLLVPVICLSLVWIYFCMVFLYYRRSDLVRHQSRVKALELECRQISIVTLNLIYFPVAKQTITMLAPCVSDRDISYLPAAPWVDCTHLNTTFIELRVIAGCAFVLYDIGIPIVVFLPLLRKYWTLLNTEENTEKTAKMKVMNLWLGSLYLPYKENVRRYFETFTLLRKFLIALSIAILPSTSTYQTLALMVIFSSAIVIQLLWNPYVNSFKEFPLENVCECLVLFVLLHSFVIIRFAVLAGESRELLWIVTISNLIVIAILVGSVLVVFRRKKVDCADRKTPSTTLSSVK